MSNRTARRAAPLISDRLRAVLKARPETPTEVAGAAGLAPSVLTRFLAGERGLTLASLDAVAEACGLRLVETAGRGRGRPRKPLPPAAPGDEIQG